LSFVVGCGSKTGTQTTPGSMAPKVLVIGVDGLRGDGIPSAETPHTDALLEVAAWTFFASTHLEAQTVSGPGWTGILTGVDANKHGVDSNSDWADINRDYPTMISRAHSLGLSTATAIHWEPIHTYIIESGVTDTAILGDDQEVADQMSEVLENANHDLHFVHFDDVDQAGHAHEFSIHNPEYRAAIEVVDGQIGQLTAAIAARATRADESWLIIVSSDHGGEGTSHGGVNTENRTIPLILSGDNVRLGKLKGTNTIPGEHDVGFVSNLDIYPTVFAHFGHSPLPDWALAGQVRGL